MDSLLVQAIKYLLPLFIALALLIGIVVILRKFFPERLWVALLLGFLLGPLGHLYIKGGFYYIIILLALGYALGYVIKDLVSFLLIFNIISSAIMYYRMKTQGTLSAELRR